LPVELIDLDLADEELIDELIERGIARDWPDIWPDVLGRFAGNPCYD
jgi:hypothetical protein